MLTNDEMYDIMVTQPRTSDRWRLCIIEYKPFTCDRMRCDFVIVYFLAFVLGSTQLLNLSACIFQAEAEKLPPFYFCFERR